MNAELQALSARVSQLETQARRYKRMAIGALALTGVVALSSASAVVCRTIYGERFVLHDEDGNERAVMNAYASKGLPEIALLDKSGRKALSLGVGDNGRAYIEVAGLDGKPVRSQFAISAEGQATIQPPADNKPKTTGEKVGMASR